MTTPMTIVSLILLVAETALAVPIVTLLAQILLALPSRRASPAQTADRPRLAVLIPAHDESSGLIATLLSVRSQLEPHDRCLVVADNCSDDTAAVAAAHGADVVERTDHRRRGKGYALDFGIRTLAADPPQVVVVVDADCLVEEGALDRLARTSLTSGRPVQALYLMTISPAARRTTFVAAFAWRVKNWVRPLGYHRLGLPCQLMGTGMAFPWDALRSVDLASGHLAEDMKLGIDLARRGAPPLFCPDARVTSSFPSDQADLGSQRTRWEHGHLGLIAREVPRLLASGIRRREFAPFALALDLAVPPLALLAMITVAGSVVSSIAALFGASPLPAVLAASLVFALFVAIASAWFRFGRDLVSPRDVGAAIGYALGKIPLYVKFVVDRQVEWVRSKRDAR